jgi:hypothetical protein
MSAVVDHEASEIDEARLRRHLTACVACTVAFDEHVAIARSMRGATLVRPPRLLAVGHARRLLVAGIGVVLLAAAVLAVTVGR